MNFIVPEALRGVNARPFLVVRQVKNVLLWPTLHSMLHEPCDLGGFPPDFLLGWAFLALS